MQRAPADPERKRLRVLSNEEMAPGYLSEKELSDLTETHTNISTAFLMTSGQVSLLLTRSGWDAAAELFPGNLP